MGSLTKLKVNGQIGSFGSLANRKQCPVMKSQLSCLSIRAILELKNPVEERQVLDHQV